MDMKATKSLISKGLMIFGLSMVISETQSLSLGLVLSGGGAKGAYEVGVWQALHEARLAGDVAAVSGTSIGAVNAAGRASSMPRLTLPST